MVEIQAIREFALEFKHLGATSIGWGYDYLEGVKVLASKWMYPVPYYITAKVIEQMMEQQPQSAQMDDDFTPEVYEYGCKLLCQQIAQEIRALGQQIADRHQLLFAVVAEGTLDDQKVLVKAAFYPRP